MHDMAAPVPGRYSLAIAVMQEMRWSWSDLQTAPGDLVDEIVQRMASTARWRREREKMDRRKDRRAR